MTSPPVLKAHFTLVRQITEIEKGVTDVITQGLQILSGKMSVSFLPGDKKKKSIGLLTKSS